MKYLRKTRNLPLILGTGGIVILKWWIDESFAVHTNMIGNNGGGLSRVIGLSVATSTKQKLSPQTSIESEIFGVDDCMPAVCWTRYFLESQDYNITEKIFYQSN